MAQSGMSCCRNPASGLAEDNNDLVGCLSREVPET